MGLSLEGRRSVQEGRQGIGFSSEIEIHYQETLTDR